MTRRQLRKNFPAGDGQLDAINLTVVLWEADAIQPSAPGSIEDLTAHADSDRDSPILIREISVTRNWRFGCDERGGDVGCSGQVPEI